MAQEDRALVLRGLLLFGAVATLVAIVLAMLFWRTAPTAASETPPEYRVLLAIVPTGADFPANVSWGAIAQLGETMPSAPGWEIRYNAATTLARRGSDKVPWPLIREMLDEKQQLRNYRVRQADGGDVRDAAAARANMLSALKALAAWHEKRKGSAPPSVPAELREIYTMVDHLVASPFGELKLQAEKAKATFFR